MAKAGVGEPSSTFRFRRLDKPEEFRQVAEVHRAVYGDDATDAPAVAVLRAWQDNGGMVLGAFADIHLAAYSAAFLGWDGQTLFEYVHSTAVRPEYQNHRLGFGLHRALRDEVLQLGLAEVRLTYDPLQSRTAWLFVRRLGGAPDRYLPHYVGQLADAANQGLETDRVRLVWSIKSPKVEARLAGTYPDRESDEARWAASSALIETEPGESGIRVPATVQEPSGASAHLEIPFDLALVRAHEPKALRGWRHAVRDAFRAATDLGYSVDDFAVVSQAHERRSCYFLSPTTTPLPG